MPKEYIEREALINKIFPIGMVDDGRYAIPAKAVKTAIDDTPAADVVEVVRCKDCKHIEMVIDLIGDYHCYCGNVDGKYITGVDFYDFCSHGERKEA